MCFLHMASLVYDLGLKAIMAPLGAFHAQVNSLGAIFLILKWCFLMCMGFTPFHRHDFHATTHGAIHEGHGNFPVIPAQIYFMAGAEGFAWPLALFASDIPGNTQGLTLGSIHGCASVSQSPFIQRLIRSGVSL